MSGREVFPWIQGVIYICILQRGLHRGPSNPQAPGLGARVEAAAAPIQAPQAEAMAEAGASSKSDPSLGQALLAPDETRKQPRPAWANQR